MGATFQLARQILQVCKVRVVKLFDGEFRQTRVFAAVYGEFFCRFGVHCVPRNLWQ